MFDASLTCADDEHVLTTLLVLVLGDGQRVPVVALAADENLALGLFFQLLLVHALRANDQADIIDSRELGQVDLRAEGHAGRRVAEVARLDARDRLV